MYSKKQALAEILYITILPFLEHIHNVLLIPPKVEKNQKFIIFIKNITNYGPRVSIIALFRINSTKFIFRLQILFFF